MVARLSISPVVPEISSDFDISTGVIGFALSAMWFTYAASQFPSGLLGDKIGERIVILIAVAGTAATSFLIVIAPSYWMFFVAVLLLGAFAGLHYSVATTLLAKTFRQTGAAIGIHSAGAPIAGLIAPVAAGALGSIFGWRYAVALGLLTAAPVAIFFWLTVRPTEPSNPNASLSDQVDIQLYSRILTHTPITITLGLAVGGAFVWQATASFFPAFIVNYHGYSEIVASVVFSWYFIIQGIGQPVVGSLSDRFGRNFAAAGSVFCGILGYGLLISVDSIIALASATVFVGVGMCWGAALLPKFLDHLPDDEQGVGFGLLRSTYMLLGASGSVVTGVFVDLFSWGVAFGILTSILGAMLIGLLLAIYFDA